MNIVIEKYNPAWKLDFEHESKVLCVAIPESDLRIEHIGSTSIIELSAKPIIDIMIGLKDFTTANTHIPEIEMLGYEYVSKYESIMPYRRFFTKENEGKRTHHIHMVEFDSEFWHRHLRFRDHLRNNKVKMSKYKELKINLEKRDWKDRNEYADAKTEFIRNIDEKLKKSN